MIRLGITYRVVLLTAAVWGMISIPWWFDWEPAISPWPLLIGGLLVVTIGTWWIVRPIDERLRAAREICERMEQGNFDARLPIRGVSFLAEFSRDFNGMMDRVTSILTGLKEDYRNNVESRHLLEVILGSMSEGVVAVDHRSQVLFINRAARPLLGTDLRAIGRQLVEVCRDAELQELVQSVTEADPEQQREIELTRSDIIVDCRAIRLSGKPSPGVVIVFRDVTDLRRLEKMRKDFVSNVSHELKTPLAAIRGFAETLLDGAIERPEFARKFVSQIDQQSERLHTLVLDLLRLARIESRESGYQLRPIALSDAINLAVDEYRGFADRKRIELFTDGDPSGVFVIADPEGLRSTFGNLLQNAIDHTPEGGWITVETSAEEDSVRIMVIDSGAGIPEEHLPRIFERFYRVDKARTRVLGGTGLGLSIVKNFLKIFGGEIMVESEVGKGSTFTIVLARVPAPATVEHIAD